MTAAAERRMMGGKKQRFALAILPGRADNLQRVDKPLFLMVSGDRSRNKAGVLRRVGIQPDDLYKGRIQKPVNTRLRHGLAKNHSSLWRHHLAVRAECRLKLLHLFRGFT